MKKSALLFISGAFLLGGVQGYWHLFPSLKQEGAISDAAKETRTDGRVSGFKRIKGDYQGSQALPSDSSWNNFLLKYAGFSPQETKAELERLLKAQKDDKKQEYILYKAIQYLSFKLAFQSPEEAKHLLDDKNNTERDSLYTSLLEGWAEKDFQGAMDYLLAHKNESREVIQAFKTLTANLVAKDTDKALKWVATLTPGERDTALDTMANDIPKLHPEKMADFLAILTSEELSSYSIRTRLASNWAVSDWDAFKAWAGTLDKRQQRSAFSSAFEGLSQIGMDKVTEKLKEIGGKHSSNTARSITYNMDYEERSKGMALDWLMENKDYFEDLPSAMEEVVGASSYKKNLELTEKVLKLPEGEVRDSALSGLINSQSSTHWSDDDKEIIKEKYADLLTLVEKIGDSEKRDETTFRCVEGWIYGSPEDAREWITNKSQFSDKKKKELFERCDGRQKEKSDELY